MFSLFIASLIILAIGLVAGFSFVAFKSRKKFGTLVIVCSAFIALCCALTSCVRTVPTGHTGIVTTFGNVEDYNYEAGVHFCAPWKTVVAMDNRNQKASVDLECFSSDIQEVAVRYTINYQIKKSNAQTIYKQIGTDYYNTVIVPRIQEAVKSVMAQYTAEELLETRVELSGEIRDILTAKLETYNIEVIDTSLENLDFSDAFTDAVEAKQVAEQKSKQAKIEQEQKTMEAEAAAKRAEIEAEAAAAVAKIDADAAAEVAKIAATAEAEVVKIGADAKEYAGEKDSAVIKQLRDTFATDPSSLTHEDLENLLMYYYIQAWNGELPTTYFGSDDFYALLAAFAASKDQQPSDTSVAP